MIIKPSLELIPNSINVGGIDSILMVSCESMNSGSMTVKDGHLLRCHKLIEHQALPLAHLCCILVGRRTLAVYCWNHFNSN